MTRSAIMPIIIGAALAIFVAMLGSSITVLDGWYRSLTLPSWTPAGPMFGMIWTIIFALTALAGILAWLAIPTRRASEALLGLFAINGFFNILWSLLFFRAERPDWAFYELILLWLSVLALIVYCRRYSWPSALLLVPYLAWVTAAGVLNYQVIQLNGPFG